MRPRSTLLLFLVAVTGCDAAVTGTGSDAATVDGSSPALDGESASGDGASGPDSGPDRDSAPATPESPLGLDAYAARNAVGLDWDPVPGAESYNLYWSTEPGPTPSTGMPLPDVAPGYVHRGLEEGRAYHYVVTAVAGGVEGPPSAEASATPGGELVLHTLGTGRLDAVATDDTVALPIDRRVHVLVLAEGYLEGELPTFADDVDDWYDEVFAIEPYTWLREAFVVWHLPRASAEHVAPGSPQPADTAFRVPLTDSGSGIARPPSDGETASRVWSVIEAFGYRPTGRYPSGGRTHQLAKGAVVHILVLDPARGRSGLSGRAVRLTNPADPSENVGTGIAHGRAHEFSHAFARLIDEYLDVAITGLGVPNETTDRSSGVHNVVEENACDTLPWRHLLLGGEHNPGVAELVGAFGTADIGYHSELKCQMNGSHDNGMFFGGDDNLRVPRFCNFCRELLVFRLLEHTRVLPDPAVSWTTWVDRYRAPFYDGYGFAVPDTVPQENSLGEPRFQDCAR